MKALNLFAILFLFTSCGKSNDGNNVQLLYLEKNLCPILKSATDYTASQTDPYYICNVEQFLDFAAKCSSDDQSSCDKNITILSDLDFSGQSLTEMKHIVGDAQNSISYSGSFDGNNKAIKNLRFHPEAGIELYYSLFSSIAHNSEVKNLYFSNLQYDLNRDYSIYSSDDPQYYAHYSKRGRSGIIAGDNFGMIKNVHILSGAMDVTILSRNVSSMAYNNSGTISQSSANITQQHSQTVYGGTFVSYNTEEGIISECASKGSLHMSYHGKSWGTTGLVYNNSGYIKNSYVTTDITSGWGASTVAGIAGKNTGTIENVYFSGNIQIGGAGSILIADNQGTANHIYFNQDKTLLNPQDNEIDVSSANYASYALSSSSLANQEDAVFLSWDKSIWSWDETINDGLPHLTFDRQLSSP